MRTAAKFLRPTLLFFLLLPAVAFAKEPADYQTGEVAAEDIATPVALTVVDRAATETLRLQEAARVPVVFRFNPQAAAEAETAFRDAFAATREKFLAALEKTFPTRRLDDSQLTNAAFQELLVTFSAGDGAFPADKKLLTLWAKGASDSAVQAVLAGQLRAAAGRFIRADNLPNDLKPGVRVQLVAVTNTAAAPPLEIPRTRQLTLEIARTELIGSFPPARRSVAGFLAGLLRENCTPDAELTRESRARQTATILSAEHYDAGQILVRRGQVITAKNQAALAELDRQLALAQNGKQKTPWPWIALTVALALVGVLIWQVASRRRRGALLPAFNHDRTPEHWRQRTLAAEARAEQATAMVRAGLLPQIARFLSHDLVKRLVSQRADLLAAQNQAAGQVEDLAGRLENLETAPDSSREFYERRIAELEKELETKNEENHTLIRAQIALARRQMADAQSKAGWN